MWVYYVEHYKKRKKVMERYFSISVLYIYVSLSIDLYIILMHIYIYIYIMYIMYPRESVATKPLQW